MKFISDIARAGRKLGVKPISAPTSVLEQKADRVAQAREVLSSGRIPLLVGRSGTGKTVIGRELLALPQDGSEPMFDQRRKLNRLLHPDDYFKAKLNGYLLIDELGICVIDEPFFNMLAVALSHEMKVVMTVQTLRDLDELILNDERVVIIHL